MSGIDAFAMSGALAFAAFRGSGIARDLLEFPLVNIPLQLTRLTRGCPYRRNPTDLTMPDFWLEQEIQIIIAWGTKGRLNLAPIASEIVKPIRPRRSID